MGARLPHEFCQPGRGLRGGVFALAPARLGYIPRASTRIRVVSPAEWTADRLRRISIEPKEKQNGVRSNRWGVMSVKKEYPTTLLNKHRGLLANDLHAALLRARQQGKPTD